MAINTDWAIKDCRDCVNCVPLIPEDNDDTFFQEALIWYYEVMFCKKHKLNKPTFNACHSHCPKRN